MKSPSMLLHPGSVYAQKYRIDGQLGFGPVYAARDTSTGQQVVLKWIPGEPQTVRYAQLRHPNLPEVYELLDDGEQQVLVMERLHGDTLASLLARGGTPLDRYINTLMMAMYGIAEVHRHGLVHGALQPEHIALIRAEDPACPHVKVMGWFGVPQAAYLSPEQLGAQRIDGRTDVYAFGVLLYRAITGRFPHPVDTMARLAERVRQPAIPAQTFCAGLPSGLCRVIGDALARDPEARIPSLPAFLTELKPYAFARGLYGEGEALTVRPLLTSEDSTDFISASPSIPPSYTRARPRRIRSRGAAALLVLALAFAALLWRVHGGALEVPTASEAERRVPEATPIRAPNAQPPRAH
ncbi:MAG TPA: serine/threonine-protein kinase [Polyangiales bacterium]